ncbi:hypothetical protein PCE1_004108 [Barthelona sp. PCE]
MQCMTSEDEQQGAISLAERNRKVLDLQGSSKKSVSKFSQRYEEYLNKLSQKNQKSREQELLKEVRTKAFKKKLQTQILAKMRRDTKAEDTPKSLTPRGDKSKNKLKAIKTKLKRSSSVARTESPSSTDDPKPAKKLRRSNTLDRLSKPKERRLLVKALKPETTLKYKKAMGYPINAMLYTISPVYIDMQRNFAERDWISNEDVESEHFNFKMTVRRVWRKTVLGKTQIVNHFASTGCLTTKIGLFQKLRERTDFFPKSYNLESLPDCFDFLFHFKQNYIVSFLLKHLPCECPVFSFQSFIEDPMLLNLRSFIALKSFIARIDIPQTSWPSPDIVALSGIEWQLLLDDWTIHENVLIRNSSKFKQALDMTYSVEGGQTKQMHKTPCEWFIGLNPSKNVVVTLLNGLNVLVKDYEATYRRVMREVNKLITPVFNGDNLWILKPGKLSRGRGIEVVGDMNFLTSLRNNSSFLLQQYCEEPLLLQNKKFDIRQWVLVTSINPLQIFFFDGCYFRLCSTNYDTQSLDPFIHLSNNCVQQNAENYDEAGNMWSVDQFVGYISQTKTNVTFDSIQERMKEIVIETMLECQSSITHRDFTFELFGFDFLIDVSGGVWLLEVNSSPTFIKNTPVMEDMVTTAFNDLVPILEELFIQHIDTKTGKIIRNPKVEVDEGEQSTKEYEKSFNHSLDDEFMKKCET